MTVRPLNPYALGEKLRLRSREIFQRDVRAFQHSVLCAALGAMLAFVGLMCAMLPWAPAFRQFLHNQIGGDLAECLFGASLPLAASPPIILFFIWMSRRTTQDSISCVSCRHFFISNPTLKTVLDTGRCPKCGAEQFMAAVTTAPGMGEQAYAPELVSNGEPSPPPQ